MPLTAQILQQKLLAEIAPGNPERFYQLLTEADELLLNSHKGRWTRTSLVLQPLNGLIILPDGFESIVGSRLGNEARSVGWEEVEFLEDGPGRIPIQGGCNGRLIDQGLLMLPNGDMSLSVLEPEVNFVGVLKPSFPINSYPSYSTTGSVAPPTNEIWARLFWVLGFWHLHVFENSVLIYSTESDASVTPFPFDASWSEEILVNPVLTLQRCYKVTGADVNEVTVLARFEAKEIADENDTPRCQSFSALKRAMLSIVYEENNDIKSSVDYFNYAIAALDAQEQAYRGTAKQVFKPALFGPLRLRRYTNFR